MLPEKDDDGRQVFIMRPGDCSTPTVSIPHCVSCTGKFSVLYCAAMHPCRPRSVLLILLEILTAFRTW